MPDPLDVLCFAAHPDDVELCAGGTVATLAQQGYRVGVVDLTRGEMGTRGTPAIRDEEAAEASRILGLVARENLGLPDGHLENTPENRRQVIAPLRRYRPRLVLVGALEDRHPDHGNAARLVLDALFQGGLRRIETAEPDGTPHEPWRPAHVLHYMHAIPFEPTFVVDVTDVWETRMAALRAFRSQFDPDYETDAPGTFISDPAFFAWVEARARHYGYRIGATYGEPLLYHHGPVGVTDLMQTLARGGRT
ncbi:MAG TPA: bacillithiol biosynthesis deacetylase BshB1 [Rubricoccaceae bacterium]|nr:bacillithiol biosynthesis deacetylase BshB1 [Rubricoccaceae bacterium]